MGYDSENAGKIVFDVETAPLDDAADYLEPATAPSNYTKPDTIAAYIAKANAEALSKCSLDPDLCRIVAIGVYREQNGHAVALVAKTVNDEAALLTLFWQYYNDRHLVGYNCLGFDLPVLLRRSLYLGVKAPSIQLDRFRHPQVTDLMQVLSYNGALRFRGLSFYAKRMGITSDPDVLTGADIGQAVKDGNWDGIAQHVKADVQKTAALASRLGLFHV